MKPCRVCRLEKPLTAFAIDRRRSDGLCSRCRECRRLAYEEKREVVSEHSRAYNKANRSRVNARNLAYYHRNKADRSRKMAAWYKSNRTRIAEVVRAYRAANPGFEAAKQAKRRSALRQAIPAWADLSKIAEIYESAAWLSENDDEKWHVDHIVPLQGKTVCGLHCEENLALLSASENISKSNRWWPDMWDT